MLIIVISYLLCVFLSLFISINLNSPQTYMKILIFSSRYNGKTFFYRGKVTNEKNYSDIFFI